jgi:hypothetical protein
MLKLEAFIAYRNDRFDVSGLVSRDSLQGWINRIAALFRMCAGTRKG